MPRRRIYIAARDHLEQAEALLSHAGSDVIEVRCVLRHLMSTLTDLRCPPCSADVIDFGGYVRRVSEPES